VGTVACNSVDIFYHARSSMRNTFGGAMKCRYCGNLRDAGIQDNIPVCHACYCKRGGVNE
jgi:hypothetical protein